MNAKATPQAASTRGPRHRTRPACPKREVVAADERLSALVKRDAAVGAGRSIIRSGHHWAARAQRDWLDELNSTLPGAQRVSLRTFQSMIARTPFVRRRATVDGKVVCLLRLGVPDPSDPERDACERLVRVLASTWRRRAGRVPTARDYGLIRELAKGLPEDGVSADAMPTILSWTIRSWRCFMAGVRCDPGWTGPRYFKYPALSVIVRFRHVAVEGYRTFVVEPALTREWTEMHGTSGEDRLAESFSPECKYYVESNLTIMNKSQKKDSAIVRLDDGVPAEPAPPSHNGVVTRKKVDREVR